MLSKSSKVLVATFSAWSRNKRLPTNGSIEPLIDFFTPKIAKIVLIDQPVPGSDRVIPIIEVHEKGKKVKIFSSSKWLYILYPFLKLTNTPKTHIDFKIRDFLSVFDWYLRDRKSSYDYFIGLESINAITGIILKKLGFIKKVIYYVSDYSPQRYPDKWFNDLYLRLDRYAATHSDYIWDVSKAMHPARIKVGLDPDKSAPVIHVPNGLYPKQIAYNPLNKTSPFSLVFMGILLDNTGPDLAVKALSYVLQKFPKTKLHIIGGGYKEDKKRLTSLVSELSLKDKVKFYGVILDEEKMSGIIRNCSIGLAPYLAIPGSIRYYGDAGKIRTYAAAGLPVITTDVPPLGKELKEKGGALVVKDNPKDLAECIIKIFSDRRLYLKLRQNSIKFAQNSTWENTYMHAFRKIYELGKT